MLDDSLLECIQNLIHFIFSKYITSLYHHYFCIFGLNYPITFCLSNYREDIIQIQGAKMRRSFLERRLLLLSTPQNKDNPGKKQIKISWSISRGKFLILGLWFMGLQKFHIQDHWFSGLPGQRLEKDIMILQPFQAGPTCQHYLVL